MIGSIIFLGNTESINHIQSLVENSDIITDEVNCISEAKEYELENQFGILYKVEFINNQWFDLMSLSAKLEHLDVDIIHALSDGENFIEVLSNNQLFDEYAEYPYIDNLSKMYQIDLVKEHADVDDLTENDLFEDEDDDSEDCFNDE